MTCCCVCDSSNRSWVYKFTNLQQTASAKRTLQSKEAFERFDKAQAWVDACNNKQEDLTFAAVGAHHQTGKDERQI